MSYLAYDNGNYESSGFPVGMPGYAYISFILFYLLLGLGLILLAMILIKWCISLFKRSEETLGNTQIIEAFVTNTTNERFIIEDYGTEAYLYVYDKGETFCKHDWHYDSIEGCKKHAYEEYNLPKKTPWEKLEINKEN